MTLLFLILLGCLLEIITLRTTYPLHINFVFIFIYSICCERFFCWSKSAGIFCPCGNVSVCEMMNMNDRNDCWTCCCGCIYCCECTLRGVLFIMSDPDKPTLIELLSLSWIVLIIMTGHTSISSSLVWQCTTNCITSIK